MKTPLTTFGLASAAAMMLSLSAQAQNTTTYNGNTNTGFDGAVGNGMLKFSTDGTTLTGTITNGSTSSGFNDTLVIYIDDTAGGFTSTSTFTDTGTGSDANDNLRASVSGYSSNTNTRAPLNFASGFGADYAISIGPNSASFGALFTLSSASAFTYGSNGSNGNLNLTPTGTGTSATYTFSLPLSLIGSPTSFNFASTYLDGGTFVNSTTGAMDSAYRSNETYGNTLTDTTNPGNVGNIGQDTATLGFQTFFVPEPGTWAMLFAGLGLLIGFQRRRQRL